MPTSLPRRQSSRATRPDLVILFLLALAASFFVVELVDPAPMDVEAALVTSP